METIPRKVLFVRTDRMGDVLMNLPALRLLRQAYPKAWIAVMVGQELAPLLRTNPDIDELILVDPPRIKRDLGYRLMLARKLRRRRFQLGIVSNPDKYLHTLLFLAGIPIRVGYDRKRAIFLNRRLPDRKAVRGRHETQNNLDLVRVVTDKTWDGLLRLVPESPAVSCVRGRFAGLPPARAYAAVHIGTSNPRKRWPGPRFAELCDRLAHETGLTPILIGGPEETEASRELSGACRARPINWVGLLSLSELLAFFACPQIKLLVSVDSGPVHIAWISGVPIVGLYARDVPGSDPARWGPLGPGCRVIHKPVAEISVDEVLSLAKETLHEKQTAPGR